MNIVLQIPIIDLRIAASTAKDKLRSPTWPNPSMNKKPFIRRFGQVLKRTQGGVDDWTGEEYFCNSVKAIQYRDLHMNKFRIDAKGSFITPINLYKRFFSDGMFMNKIELGLKDDFYTKSQKLEPGSEPIDIITVLKHYLTLPVRINKSETSLFKSGELLSEVYYKGTTRHKSTETSRNLISDGEICMLSIFSEMDKFNLPREAKLVTTIDLPGRTDALKLYGYTLHIDGYYIKVWLLIVPKANISKNEPSYAVLRNLRINLMRVHAEKETIKSILRSQDFDTTNNASGLDLVSNYLKRTSETLFKKERMRLNQERMLDFALYSEDMLTPGSFSNLQGQIQNAFTKKNMQKFIQQSTKSEKKVILFVCSSPTNKNPLDFGYELNQIQELLLGSSDRAYYEDIKIKTGVTRQQFQNALTSLKPDVLHISMHSSPTEGLYFEGLNREAAPMSAEEWIGYMSIQSKVHRPQTIILSACNSKLHAESSINYCDYAIGTQTLIDEKASVAYAKGFYAILFNDKNSSIEVCHDAGINAVKFNNPPFQSVGELQAYQIIFMLKN